MVFEVFITMFCKNKRNNSGRQTILQQQEVDRESSGGGGIRTFEPHSVQELERESDERERASDSYQRSERGTHQNNNIPGIHFLLQFHFFINIYYIFM